MITNPHTRKRSKSYRELYDDHQKNRKYSFLGWIDILFLKLLLLIRTIWRCVPIFIRGPVNQSEVFSSFVQRFKLKVTNNLTLSN